MFFGTLYAINIIIAFIIVFLERKEPAATLAWIMVLFLVPIGGIILYITFSQNLAKEKIFTLLDNEEALVTNSLRNQNRAIATHHFDFKNPQAKKWQALIRLNQVYGSAYFTQDNSIDLFIDGTKKLESLLEDVRAAKESINIEYFIIKKDIVGDALLVELINKAKEGLEVKLLVDALGSRTIDKDMVTEFINSGGKFAQFFPTKWKFFNNKINYRNHRKLVIIDNKVGYIGGFNIAREYVGLKKKFGYWRDTHIRVEGSSVFDLNSRFLLDWRSAAQDEVNVEEAFFEAFEQDKPNGDIGIQIVSSGPDTAKEEIKRGMLKMITGAKKSIYIQTPYFVPDATILESHKMAAQSGVNVNIMIPCRPDHVFVYWATYSYVAEIIDAGGHIFIYDNGFLHSKTMTVDGEVCTVGSTNFDRRSFKLNFEANAFIFDTKFTKELEDAFKTDLASSHKLTKELYDKRGTWIKIKEALARVLSDIL